MSASPRHPLVSIIVPTRNEAENIAPLVEQIVSSAAPFHEILFVDDDSTDGTRNAVRLLAASYPIRLIEQDRAEVGLAAAIMSAASKLFSRRSCMAATSYGCAKSQLRFAIARAAARKCPSALR